MNWICASVVAVATGLCSAASSQPTPSAGTLFQAQYDERGYGSDQRGYGDNDNVYPDRDAYSDQRSSDRYQDEDQGAYSDQYRTESNRQEEYDRSQDDRDSQAYRSQDDTGQRTSEYDRGYEDGQRAANGRADEGSGVDQARFERCSRRYRTFDAASGTYMGFDGHRHVCQ